ncbi:MAG: flagellin, partial [Rhodospirillaceae bacterium]
VSTDGRTITLNDDPTLTTDETITGNWTVSELNFPLGPIEVTGAGANNQTYTVTDIALDGNTLTVSPAPNLTAAGVADVTIEPQSYYQGDGLIYQHRVDDNRSIELGITAKDPAFEKAIRGMGIIAQGDLANNTQRIQEALDLLNDALDHNSNSAELSSDLESLAETIGYNQVTLNRAITDGQDYSSFLRTRAGEIEDADITEAVVRLQDDAQALEVSYQAFARITQLSLNNFI